jgi:hypothetical protein
MSDRVMDSTRAPTREHAGKINVFRWQKWRRALKADRSNLEGVKRAPAEADAHTVFIRYLSWEGAGLRDHR